MWNRIQTVYLALALGLIGSLFFCKAASILGPDGVSHVYFVEKITYLILVLICLLAQIMCIGTFKVRMLQYRLTLLTTLILLGLQGLIIFDWVTTEGFMPSVPAWFPLVSAILNSLAIKNILADEALIRAASRLRRTRK